MPWSLCLLLAGFLALSPLPRSRPATAGRIERFALELPSKSETGVQEVGWLELRAFTSKVPSRLEWEIYFAEAKVRVLHVEQVSADTARLVWREIGTESRRSLLVVLEQDSAKVTEWSSGECIREQAAAGKDARLPLQLIESLRSASAGSLGGSVDLFNPLRRAFERLEAGEPTGADPEHAEREISLRREDGTEALRLIFSREELMEIHWQREGLRARRIGYSDFERLRGALDPSSEG